jgi:hypothetical protein
MTSAIRLGIHSQAGYGFYVKLTPISIAKPLHFTLVISLKSPSQYSPNIPLYIQHISLMLFVNLPLLLHNLPVLASVPKP